MDRSETIKLLEGLFASQHLAVLATNRRGQPYTSLVAFAVTDDLKHFIFATSRATQKYENMKDEPRVALLVDSRANREEDFQSAVAVTAFGKAEELKLDDQEALVRVFLEKHLTLREFVASFTTALFSVKVERYSIVTKFQDVVEFDPEK